MEELAMAVESGTGLHAPDRPKRARATVLCMMASTVQHTVPPIVQLDPTDRSDRATRKSTWIAYRRCLSHVGVDTSSSGEKLNILVRAARIISLSAIGAHSWRTRLLRDTIVCHLTVAELL